MTIFHVDELSFDLPADFEDKSVNVFTTSDNSLSVTVAREPIAERPLAEHLDGTIAKLQAGLESVRLLGHRPSELGNLPAVEARVHCLAGGVPLYQRQAYIDWFGQLLLLSVTAMSERTVDCDALADQLFESLRFRTC